MRLPKRVPWSNPSELEQVFSWIYGVEDETAAKFSAVNRLAAWKASTALPHALDSTLSLLVAILQDEDYSNSSHTSSLSLRQSYSLALIRLVNGLVDPLQHGAYARPIASIASQIGLPLWLVELRHASTHEGLPSLELLREGAREAMSWLLRNYFLPTISPVNQSVTARVTLSPFTPLLAQYKGLLKTTTRDASLKSHSKPELARILRDVDRWILEAKVAASMFEMDAETQGDEEYEKERWALERLSDALIGPGGLVPVSQRKRLSPAKELMLPDLQYVALWSPLVLHIHSRFPVFPSILLFRIIHQIISSPQVTSASSVNDPPIHDIHPTDVTFDHTLASWVLWIIDRWGNDPYADCEPREAIKELLLSLGRGENRTVVSLLKALSESDLRLKKCVDLLSTGMEPLNASSAWEDNALTVMSERLSQLSSDTNCTRFSPPSLAEDNLGDVALSTQSDTSAKPSSQQGLSVRGWRLLDESSGWKPCPIGVYHQTDI